MDHRSAGHGSHRARRAFRPAGLVAILVLAAVLIGGCTTTADEVAHTAAAFRPAREVPPIERLGRWDGDTFVRVAPGSVRGGHLYVLVHGWMPGYRAAVDRYRGPGVLLAWSPEAVDAAGDRSFAAFVPLAAALTAADPEATVLGFSWIDDSATAMSPFAARRSEARTDLNGQRLAAALRTAVAPSFAGSGALHLIGHSHGAKVATVAAIAGPKPPAQLTLLDSPENVLARLPGAANHLEGYLPLLPIGRGPGRTFVDSYFSIVGARYDDHPGLGAVVDVQLLPPRPRDSGAASTSLSDELTAAFTAAHEYPISWYATSAQHPEAGVGYAWSPLTGRPPDCIVCSFVQRRRQPATGTLAELDLVPTDRGSRTVQSQPFEVTARRGPSAGRRPEGVELAGPGNRLWQVRFDKGPQDLAVAFDVRFTDPAPGAQVAVWLDGRQVYVAAADWTGSEATRAVVDVAALDDGRHTLTAVIAPPGTRARAVLGGFTTLVASTAPDPSSDRPLEVTLALVGLGLWLVVGVLIALLRPRAATRGSGVGTAEG